jgi:transcriptional regulator with XRE-family HTH domain
MNENVPMAVQTLTENPSLEAGFRLRQVRERLHLTLRAVEELTLEIAAGEQNPEFTVSAGRLNQIETDGSVPGIYKLFSLAVVYGIPLENILELYGIRLRKMGDYRLRFPPTRTQLAPAGGADPARTLRFPVRFEPGFKPEKTAFLSRLIAAWGEIPLGLLAELDLKRYLYGYIGSDDRMMEPLLRPGSIVQIDDTRRRVANGGWANEFERPIYFLELRYSYECCWCHQRGRELMLIPHPLSPCAPRTIRVPDEGGVLGQVVGVAGRIAQ